MHWIDPEYLPETSGVVDCFLLNGQGEVDGLVLQDGTEIHLPRHIGAQKNKDHNGYQPHRPGPRGSNSGEAHPR